MVIGEGYTIVYKCNRCGSVSEELKLTCFNCGFRLIYKPVLRAIQDKEKANK